MGIENKSREETLRWLNPSARLTKDELRALPWAPVEGLAEPVVSLNQPLFELPKDDSPVPSIPPGIRVYFLKRAFQSALAERMGADGARSLFHETFGAHCSGLGRHRLRVAH